MRSTSYMPAEVPFGSDETGPDLGLHAVLLYRDGADEGQAKLRVNETEWVPGALLQAGSARRTPAHA
jgi:hypothetical protein